MAEMDLEEPRKEIDRIDSELVRLLNERARMSQEVARRKAREKAEIFVPAREQQIIENVLAVNSGPLKAEHLRSIYREVFSASRDLQRRTRVAFLGPAATFSHEAALQLFGDATEMVPVATIRDVFLETERGGTDYSVVPVENSTEGAVLDTLDGFVDTNLKACAELDLHIVQNLMARCSKDEIKTVYSHPQGLAQCRRWLSANLPKADLVQTFSTVKAAELAAGDPTGAAISPAPAAAVYGLQILKAGIQDLSTNITRFLAMGPSFSGPTGQDKTAVILTIKDRTGALYDLMGAFARNGINLSNIQSRPLKAKAWNYYFFVEMDGHADDTHVQAALRELEEKCQMVKVLGSWPKPADD